MSIRDYCHNFLSIGGSAIGPGYTVSFPSVQLPSSGTVPPFDGAENYEYTDGGLRVSRYLNSAASVRFSGKMIGDKVPFTWEMRNSDTGAMVSCQDSFVPDEIAIWSIDHMVSPETFHDYTLAPGQVESFSRKYSFDFI